MNIEYWKSELKKRNDEFDKWENSIEGVMYSLSVWGEVDLKDEENKVLIAKTLLRLPKEVRDKVLDEVKFFMMSTHGTPVTLRFSKIIEEEELKKMKKIDNRYLIAFEQPVIMLNLRARTNERNMDTIAHEIAHFILGHHKIDNKDKKAERHADDLAEKWGFRRSYKTYKQFENLQIT